MTNTSRSPVIAPMLMVTSGDDAADFYKSALGANERFRVGSAHLVALEIGDALLFVREASPPKGGTPAELGVHTAAIELFVDDPDSVVEAARRAGATDIHMEDHQRPSGVHRQGGFTDPWGHGWLVGDYSPLDRSDPRLQRSP